MTDPRSTPELIALVQALDAAATPGPWRQHGQNATHAVNGPNSTAHDSDSRVVQGDADKLSWSDGAFGGGVLKTADAEFIAQSRTLLPLLAERLQESETRQPMYDYYREVEREVMASEGACGPLSVAKLQTQLKAVLGNVAALTAERDALKGQQSVLIAAHRAEREDERNAANEYGDTLRAQVAALTAENARLKEENEKLADDVELLSNSEALKGILDGLDDIKHGRVVSLSPDELSAALLPPSAEREAKQIHNTITPERMAYWQKKLDDGRMMAHWCIIGHSRGGMDQMTWGELRALFEVYKIHAAERETPEQPS